MLVLLVWCLLRSLMGAAWTSIPFDVSGGSEQVPHLLPPPVMICAPSLWLLGRKATRAASELLGIRVQAAVQVEQVAGCVSRRPSFACPATLFNGGKVSALERSLLRAPAA